MDVQTKREREKALVTQMIALYCRENHGTKNCKVHCYKPEMREKIRAVMRYSGPRMIFHAPIPALRHVTETAKERKRLEIVKRNRSYTSVKGQSD